MEKLYERYPNLASCKEDIENALCTIIDTYKNKGKILICGNGGSSSDSDHIVGELMKGFLLKRKMDKDFVDALSKVTPTEAQFIADNLQGALPAISLTSQTALMSAFSNDVNSDMIYAQQVLGYGESKDLLICISTSGNSKNAVYAAIVGKAKNMKVLSLTGAKESKLSAISDITIKVPETETFKVQELHLPVYHYLCAKVEETFFEE